MEKKLRRWRLVLGRAADPGEGIKLEGTAQGMDAALEALYDSDRKGGLGSSYPQINRWLGDIRTYFPTDMVQLLQKDALERLDLRRILLEPELLEQLEPDVELVATLISLQSVMPQRTRDTARQVVRRLVNQLEKKLQNPLREAVRGALQRGLRNPRPKLREIDWHRTIRANLKHYQPDYQAIIPERLIGFGRKGQALRSVILLVDQSGSMAASLVYAGILGSVLASVSSLRTHLVFFDTNIADLTDRLHDPVELLFGAQLGGGTDIRKALAYAHTLVRRPTDTILVLISDLYEGGRDEALLRKARELRQLGLTFVALLALSDRGTPAYNVDMAQQFAELDIPAFACSPNQFPALMATAIRKESIRGWMRREAVAPRN
jgi:Mg-chelatase subunit ChlD